MVIICKGVCVLCAVELLWLLETLWMNAVHNVLSSESCSAPVDSCLWLLLWSQPISYLVFLFPTAFSFSLHHCLSQRTLLSHDVPQTEQLQFCHFCRQRCFSLHLLSGWDVCLPGSPGAHRGLLQHHISSESHFHPTPWLSSLPNFCICACCCKSQFLMRKEAQGETLLGSWGPFASPGSYSFTLSPREPLVHSPQVTGAREGAEGGANTRTAQ